MNRIIDAKTTKRGLPTRQTFHYPSYFEMMALLPSTLKKNYLCNKLLLGFSEPHKLKDILYTPDTVRLFDWTEKEYNDIKMFDVEQKRLIVAMIILYKMELRPDFINKVKEFRKESTTLLSTI